MKICYIVCCLVLLVSLGLAEDSQIAFNTTLEADDAEPEWFVGRDGSFFGGTVVSNGIHINSVPLNSIKVNDCWVAKYNIQLTPIFRMWVSGWTMEVRRTACFRGRFALGRYTIDHKCLKSGLFKTPVGLSSIPTLRYRWCTERNLWTEDKLETVFVKTEHPNQVVFMTEPQPLGTEQFLYEAFEPTCINFV